MHVVRGVRARDARHARAETRRRRLAVPDAVPDTAPMPRG